MSLTFKLLSLVIRTAAKPIGNYIKRQAKEHDGFRRFAVSQAQRVHRIDMRMRLGILHDPIAQERMHEREQKAAEEKKRTPTVRSEEEQKKYDEEQAKAEKEGGKKKEEKPKVRIRPLSEAKAIELGANFFSEAFIFGVAAGLLIWDSWRSRRKASNRRDEVEERLDSLESEVFRLRSRYEPGLAALEDSERSKTATTSWWNPAGWWTRTEPELAKEADVPIQGNVPGTDPQKAIAPTPTASKDPPGSKAAAEKPEHTGPVRVDSVRANSKDR